MSNPTPGVSAESPLPQQPVVGVAAIHVRDTEHQTPSQILGARLTWPNADRITTVVDAGDLSSTTGYYGGPMPEHSAHWNEYFTDLWQYLPTGKGQTFNQSPDPTRAAAWISADQDAVSGNGEDPWSILRNSFARMWTKGSAPATYKHSNP